nr:WD40 repeat domain-containing protein [Sphaerisporangium rubeum]
MTFAGHRAPVKAVTMAVLPDGRLLGASTGKDRTVRVWDGRSGAELAQVADGGVFAEAVQWVEARTGDLVLAVAAGSGEQGPARLVRMALGPPATITGPAGDRSPGRSGP